jgi:hypothetical protein
MPALKLPIGIQDFASLRNGNYVYVDKTQWIGDLLSASKYSFLARPRHFGKSLLISTLKAIFDGQKALFTGLWLENRHNFKVRPVIRLDFSSISFTHKPLAIGIVESLHTTAAQYNLDLTSNNPSDAFRELIVALAQTEQVVVLVDEYDKPITDCLDSPVLLASHTEVLKGLYGLLKALEPQLHLVFLTGISKIGKLTLFSDLNNLLDLSLDRRFAQMLGYQREEIALCFGDYLADTRQVLDLDEAKLWEQLKFWYNGYSWDGRSRLYCPFSVLTFFSSQQFRPFWYETGTPSFLLKLIRQAKLNPLDFERFSTVDSVISSSEIDRIDPVSLMFQTGYLTIQSQASNPLGMRYELSYPNEEVRQAFSRGLLSEYSNSPASTIGTIGLQLQDALVSLDWPGFFSTVNRALASIPYEIFQVREAYFHSLMHLLLVSTGFSTRSQVQTSRGRADTISETFTHTVIFEFKVGGSAATALAQIEARGYGDFSGKPVIAVGVVFDREQKCVSDWRVNDGFTTKP